MYLHRGYESLRRHRVTIPNASYFITLCTRDRALGLTSLAIAAAIVWELTRLETDASATIRAWTIMPDHMHLFLNTSGRLSLGQILGRLKAKTRLWLLDENLCWQGNYYEHRLGPEDRAEDVLRYIFLDPYRSKLLGQGDTYPHFWQCSDDAEWFQPALDDHRPLPDWLT